MLLCLPSLHGRARGSAAASSEWTRRAPMDLNTGPVISVRLVVIVLFVVIAAVYGWYKERS